MQVFSNSPSQAVITTAVIKVEKIPVMLCFSRYPSSFVKCSRPARFYANSSHGGSTGEVLSCLPWLIDLYHARTENTSFA